MAKTKQFPIWGQEFRPLCKEYTGGLTDTQVLEITRKLATAFKLTAIQDDMSGWWEAPHSVYGLW